jgi:Neuraminidase (sialidase)
METAVGNIDVIDPQIMMQYSDNGGYTWSNEKWVSVGKIGEYKTKVRWSRLGSSRNRVFKIMYSEKTFYQINGAYLNAY